VLKESLVLLAEHEGMTLPASEEYALSESLSSWPVFSEVPGALAELRERGWRLVALSNTDADLLAASMEAIGVPFEGAIVAGEIGSYKPAHGHWTTFFERTGADRERHVHVAASLFHDIAPANELGLRAVWINRMHEHSDLPREAELRDLARLPETLDELVAA
jgi:2-haloacid dehalogenase